MRARPLGKFGSKARGSIRRRTPNSIFSPWKTSPRVCANHPSTTRRPQGSRSPCRRIRHRRSRSSLLPYEPGCRNRFRCDMNLKFLKQHALLVGCIAGFVVVLAAVIWLQQSASSKRTDVEAAIDEQTSQLQHLLQMKPGPSRENIDIIKKDREQVDRLYSNLLGTVSHPIDTPPDLRPVSFLQLMASSFARLHQAAEDARTTRPSVEGNSPGGGRAVCRWGG